jgi:hypothetical protein
MLQLSAAVGLAAFAAPALAGSSDSLTNAALNTTKQSSYHISMTTAQGTTEGDVVNPDRMHMVGHGIETIVIGSTAYLKIKGAWSKMNAPGSGSMQMDVAKVIAKSRGDYTATDLGTRVVDGAPMHAYSATNATTHRTDTIFVDGSGRIARVESGPVVIRFTKFNEPVTITAPM